MSIAYFDCFAGAAGDMIVASLLDAGAPWEPLLASLGRLGIPHCRLSREQVSRGGFAASRFKVEQEHAEHEHRHLSHILAIIDAAGLPQRAAARARQIFTRLAQAEAKVHRTSIESIHFHEVGAADSIMDIVGACVAMELLNIENVYCSAIPTGGGVVDCAHGTLPVPAPATVELLRGARVVRGQADFEMTTPTGAAILTSLAEGFDGPPEMKLSSVGYGAGTRELGGLPNVLRVLVGQAGDGDIDSVVELSANVDDCTGEVLGAAIEKLLSAGCLDAWAAPIVMKKSRPAWMIGALCLDRDAGEMQRLLFSQTTTFGVRMRRCLRGKLHRRHDPVETPYGPIRVKVGFRGEQVFTAAPEFADCAAAADAHGVSVKEVLAAAEACWREKRKGQ